MQQLQTIFFLHNFPLIPPLMQPLNPAYIECSCLSTPAVLRGHSTGLSHHRRVIRRTQSGTRIKSDEGTLAGRNVSGSSCHRPG